MEFGIALRGRGPLAKPDVLLRMAAKAEALRYDSVFVTDHVVLPASSARSTYPYSPTGQFPGGAQQEYLEPLVLLGWLAHATRRIRLGTSVLVVPYRNPLLTAKMLATLDTLARGRLILGVGVGWLAEEFEALAAPAFAERGAVTDEYVALMRAAWTEDPVSFEGRHYRVKDVHVLPKPAQPHGIPVWIGGHSDAAVKRAGRLGDGWHPIGGRPPAVLDPDEYAGKVDLLRRAAREAGRRPDRVTLSLRIPMQVRSPRAKALAGDRPHFQGTAAEVRGDVERYAALGVTHFVFDAIEEDLPGVLTNIARFAEDVRPRVRASGPDRGRSGADRSRRRRARGPRPVR
ncbi:MAG: LLM class F420-dependent oxidoreductase [Candidatus Rokubacteria bacterium]|nr:LLM class F420-dependent oxidoreductase [Candidatus Rokubacteria bacterium]